MKLEVKESELKTLEKDKKGLYFYTINTKTGTMKVEGIKTIEEALKSVEKNLIIINKSMLKKQLKK